MKNYPNALKNALRSKSGHTFQHIITMELSGLILRLTDSTHDILFQGNTYLSNSLINEFEALENEEDLVAQEYEVVFTAVDQTILSLFLNTEQRGRKVVVNRILMQPNTNLAYDTPLLTSFFKISGFTTDGQTISIGLRGALTDLFQVKGIVTTMESFRKHFPNSTSCINSSSVNDKLKWGGQ